MADLRDRVLFLQKIVNQKDKFDQSRYDKKTDDIILCKVLIESPNEQLMKIFTELQATKNALSIIYRKYNRLKTEQKELLHLNYVNSFNKNK